MTGKQQPGLEDFQWDAGSTTLEDFDKKIMNVSVKDGEEDSPVDDKDAKFFETEDADEPEVKVPVRKEEKPIVKSEEEEEEEDDDKKESFTSEEADEDELYANLFKDSVESGMFILEEGEELPDKMTPEEYYERVEKSLELRVEQAIETMFKDELDQEAIAFLKFKKSGGSTKAFLEAYGQVKEYSKMDISRDSTMKQVVKDKLLAEGLSQEEADDEIETLEELGKLEMRAKTYYNQFVRKEEQLKTELVERQKQAKVAQETQRKETYGTLSGVVKKGNAAGVQLSKKDAEIPEYIMAPASKGENVSQFTKDLRSLYEDPEKLVLLAKLVKSGLELADLKAAVETDTVRKARRSLVGDKRKDSSFSATKKSLADFI